MLSLIDLQKLVAVYLAIENKLHVAAVIPGL